MGHGREVALNRALSKIGILSRAQATAAIHEGRVRVDGRIVRDPLHQVVPERARILVDDEHRRPIGWRTVLLHKSRGVVTTRSDPDRRRTVYDLLGDAADGLQAVGRLDLATSGLLLLTTDTQLANWIIDPANGVVRVYVVTVRGEVTPETLARLGDGVTLRKSSRRESHLTVELREGKNRQVRRMFAAAGHEVTRLKRVRLGGLELGTLEPAQWREVNRDELRNAFPGAPIRRDL